MLTSYTFVWSENQLTKFFICPLLRANKDLNAEFAEGWEPLGDSFRVIPGVPQGVKTNEEGHAKVKMVHVVTCLLTKPAP